MVRDVFEATIDELARAGYGALRTDEVAARAGVAKTTIYRRWPTKAALVEAALRDAARFEEPLPDTGTLREDLVLLVQATVGRLSSPRARAIARLVSNEADPEVDQLARKLKEERRRGHSVVVVRAQERGEIASSVDPSLVIEVVLAPIFTRVVRGERPSRETIEAIVDLVVFGASAPRAKR